MELKEEFQSKEVLDSGWVDIHAHLNFLDISPEQAIQECVDQGMHRVITIGTEPGDLPVVQELAKKFAPHVFCTLGIHPHEAKRFDQSVDDYLCEKLTWERVVAVGEIGLDFYYDSSPVDKQIAVFRRQMEIAEQFDLPVQIHTRDADEETIKVLNEFKGRVRGIIHCFTGTQKLAEAALDCGYNISFSGILTFKNAEDLRKIAALVPIDRMHVETDSPFLSPIPLRGKKNRPTHMLWTAQKMSEIKGIGLALFCRQMKQNALKMFPRMDWHN